MPSYKLTYFDAPGRAEGIRWLLHYMGVEFEDYRFPREKWPELKKEIKFGKVPILEIDGKRMYQSEAICRYLAKQCKLAGDDDMEAYAIDCLIGTLGDIGAQLAPLRMQTDPQKREEAVQKIKTETMPYYLNIYNEMAKDGHLVNGKLTWADIAFTSFLTSANDFIDFGIEKYPNLTALKEKVCSQPGIKKYLDSKKK